MTCTTTYKNSARVTHCYNLANLVPRNNARQKCITNKIIISLHFVSSHKRTDYFGNQRHHFEIQTPHTELSIKAESEVELVESNNEPNLDIGISYAEVLRYLQNNSDVRRYSICLDSRIIKANKELTEYARPSFSSSRSLHACVADLTSRIYKDFSYTPGFTNIATPLSEVLEHKKGVWQDFAHLQVGCLRAMGIPAKYVSGYMETLPPPGQEKLVGADATHAWVSYFSPEEGWVEFDPTNDVRAGGQHIVTAEGRDYYDVTPLKGVIFGGDKDHILEVSVDVARQF